MTKVTWETMMMLTNEPADIKMPGGARRYRGRHNQWLDLTPEAWGGGDPPDIILLQMAVPS